MESFRQLQIDICLLDNPLWKLWKKRLAETFMKLKK